MKTLYDLLGVRPDESAEEIKNAFRKAAKAHHPDLHGGDPDAPMRFARIARAYAVLRDAQKRAEYDRHLRDRRSQTIRRFAAAVIAGVMSGAGIVVAGVLGGGGIVTLVIWLSDPPSNTQEASEPSQTSPIAATIAPARPQGVGVVADSRGPREGSPSESDGTAARTNRRFDWPSQFQASARSAEPSSPLALAPEQLPATNGLTAASPEKDDGVAQSSSPNFAEKYDLKTYERRRIVAKRQITNHTPFKQASLEIRNAPGCTGSQSCSGHAPPLFGVGF